MHLRSGGYAVSSAAAPRAIALAEKIAQRMLNHRADAALVHECGDQRIRRAIDVATAPVILVLLEHAHAAVEDAWQPELRVARVALIVVQARVEPVRLNVGFVYRVQAERSAELVEAMAVWVVRHAHRVEVCVLHQQNVYHH